MCVRSLSINIAIITVTSIINLDKVAKMHNRNMPTNITEYFHSHTFTRLAANDELERIVQRNRSELEFEKFASSRQFVELIWKLLPLVLLFMMFFFSLSFWCHCVTDQKKGQWVFTRLPFYFSTLRLRRLLRLFLLVSSSFGATVVSAELQTQG